MCGIAAIFSWKANKSLEYIKSMTDLIRHRGPDDEGFALFSLDPDERSILFGGKDSPEELFKSPSKYAPKDVFPAEVKLNKSLLAFGHRRLSIVDLSVQGHQPMCDLSGRYWITYNGEIYNHVELRKELEEKGYRFCTQSDTEVILAAYHEWGKRCLDRFNGMFAFVLFDRKEEILFVARDRFAVKPLYYWFSPAGFLAIASEIKQFTVLPGWKSELNGQAAYDFLNWAVTNHEEETFFKGVYQVRGGHFFQVKLQENTQPVVRPQPWYTIPLGSYKKSLTEAAAEFAHLLKDSVKIRCRTDVSLGSCLSGGLDSSSIVCLIHSILQEEKNTYPQKTFSACSHYPEFDEQEYIWEVVKNTNICPEYTYPSLDQLFAKLDTITWHQEQPFGSTSIFAQWEVFDLAKKACIKVMLDGQGSDEQLAGYRAFLSAQLADLAKEMEFGLLRKELQACKEVHNISFPLKLLFNQILPDWIKQPIRKCLNKTTHNPPWLNNKLLCASLRDPSTNSLSIKSQLLKLSYMQITRTHLPMLLHFEDRNSMAHSIEARNPFLDYRLLELILSLPSEYKLKEGISKIVLREGLKHTLPEKIRNRVSKLAFAAPEEIWVRKHNPQLFLSLVKESVSASQGILNSTAITKAESIIYGSSSYDPLLWRILIFGRWMQQFNVSI